MDSPSHEDIAIVQADLDNCLHTRAFITLINAYASDPMGAGTPLPSGVQQRLISGLQAQPGTTILLATVDDRFVAFTICFRGFSTFRAMPLLNIHDIYVMPEHRSQGIARRLIRRVAEIGQSMDCCKITLEVREDNSHAEQLYRKLGFGCSSSGVEYKFLEKPL